MSGQTIDPITLQVINGALQTIAEEMGHVLYRMSFSSIIRESQDLGAGLFDAEFNNTPIPGANDLKNCEDIVAQANALAGQG